MTEKQKLFQELNDRMVKDLGIKETNKTMNKERLLQLDQLMKNHDWYYEMSDEHRVWESGRVERNEIENLMEKLGDEAKKLWKKHTGEEYPRVYPKGSI